MWQRARWPTDHKQFLSNLFAFFVLSNFRFCFSVLGKTLGELEVATFFCSRVSVAKLTCLVIFWQMFNNRNLINSCLPFAHLIFFSLSFCVQFCFVFFVSEIFVCFVCFLCAFLCVFFFNFRCVRFTYKRCGGPCSQSKNLLCKSLTFFSSYFAIAVLRQATQKCHLFCVK